MSIFHIVVCVVCIIAFCFLNVLIYLKTKKLQTAIACYSINALWTAILIYSLFLTINQYIKQASLSELRFARNLRTESIVISGRVTNLTEHPLNKCFLELTIVDKRGSSNEIFNPNAKNVPKSRTPGKVSYNIQIVTSLPGNTYKKFSVQVPYPPSFVSAEFYHILNCI
ncbi:hypothetical protein DMB92_07180 [Campylobacter sp. MIT 99-7217]|uniref:DUF2393 family protein n=1 Tax=Campylobacter sp. MIT 99-7217 TaxID=535091 RepID=UPI001158C0E3|nr:DUF2393 family protein [Campylobacter sp. MIT 99-7217]TQR30997.1 hypothetical protein DMB92_07180 [Campylobacter sp. MIT 99-7217]